MNTIDLIVYLILAVAVWNGWRKGFIIQIMSLAGLAISIWTAARYGAQVGEWLKLDPKFATIAGFIATLVVVLIGVSLLARAVRKLFHFVGFGIADILLGIAISILKYGLLTSVLMSTFDSLNADYTLVEKSTIEHSKTYRPIINVSRSIVPMLKELEKHLPEETNKTLKQVEKSLE